MLQSRLVEALQWQEYPNLQSVPWPLGGCRGEVLQAHKGPKP